jgi:hypothetical protein
MSIAAEMATGAPKPAAPSMNAPKLNAISSAWMRRSAERPAMDCRTMSNCPTSSGLHRDVVEEDHMQDDPADRHEAEERAIGRGRERHRCRHVVDKDRGQVH